MLQIKVITKETEFKDVALQLWIGQNYRGHFCSFRGLVSQLCEDGFQVQGLEGEKEILDAVNAMLTTGLIRVNKIFSGDDGTAIRISECEFKIYP